MENKSRKTKAQKQDYVFVTLLQTYNIFTILYQIYKHCLMVARIVLHAVYKVQWLSSNSEHHSFNSFTCIPLELQICATII